ncbi:hypothetical protein GOV04_04500 [Candidatus Woesearchaeota archaeon]|nr:hypothetical protein [Candidatus Woesearchaeota archaeon]
MKHLQRIALLIVLLMMSLPMCFAAELNLVYDANGNLQSGDGKYREYNSLNQLVRIRNGSTDSDPILQEYMYHPTEERVLKKVDYVKNETVYYWSKNFVTVSNSSGSFNYTYVYHNGQIVAQEVSGTKTFIHSDHLGSSTVVTDASGDVIENTSYSPFGEVLTGGDATRYGYEAKEHDTVVGDTDFHFRKYKAEWGLFTQPDTLIQNVYDPQNLNRYMFERGNPYKYTDPTGHVIPILMAVGVIIIVSTIVSTTLSLINYYTAETEEQKRKARVNLEFNALSAAFVFYPEPYSTGAGVLGIIYSGGTAAKSLYDGHKQKKDQSENGGSSTTTIVWEYEGGEKKPMKVEYQTDEQKDASQQTQSSESSDSKTKSSKQTFWSKTKTVVKSFFSKIGSFFGG